MMTRPGENWRFVALLSRRRRQMGDGGWGVLDLSLSRALRAALFFASATETRQLDHLTDRLAKTAVLWDVGHSQA